MLLSFLLSALISDIFLRVNHTTNTTIPQIFQRQIALHPAVLFIREAKMAVSVGHVTYRYTRCRKRESSVCVGGLERRHASVK